MPRHILKYELQPLYLKTEIDLPVGFEIIKVGMQGDTPCIWVIANLEHDVSKRTFQVLGTGFEVDENLTHLGTDIGDPFVWHFFLEEENYEV